MREIVEDVKGGGSGGRFRRGGDSLGRGHSRLQGPTLSGKCEEQNLCPLPLCLPGTFHCLTPQLCVSLLCLHLS